MKSRIHIYVHIRSAELRRSVSSLFEISGSPPDARLFVCLLIVYRCIVPRVCHKISPRKVIHTTANKADFAAIVREITGTGVNRVMNFNYAPAQ